MQQRYEDSGASLVKDDSAVLGSKKPTVDFKACFEEKGGFGGHSPVVRRGEQRHQRKKKDNKRQEEEEGRGVLHRIKTSGFLDTPAQCLGQAAKQAASDEQHRREKRFVAHASNKVDALDTAKSALALAKASGDGHIIDRYKFGSGKTPRSVINRQTFLRNHGRDSKSGWDSATVKCGTCSTEHDASSSVYIRWKPIGKGRGDVHCCSFACAIRELQRLEKFSTPPREHVRAQDEEEESTKQANAFKNEVMKDTVPTVDETHTASGDVVELHEDKKEDEDRKEQATTSDHVLADALDGASHDATPSVSHKASPAEIDILKDDQQQQEEEEEEKKKEERARSRSRSRMRSDSSSSSSSSSSSRSRSRSSSPAATTAVTAEDDKKEKEENDKKDERERREPAKFSEKHPKKEEEEKDEKKNKEKEREKEREKDREDDRKRREREKSQERTRQRRERERERERLERFTQPRNRPPYHSRSGDYHHHHHRPSYDRDERRSRNSSRTHRDRSRDRDDHRRSSTTVSSSSSRVDDRKRSSEESSSAPHDEKILEKKIINMMSKFMAPAFMRPQMYYTSRMSSASPFGYPVDAPDLVHPTAPDGIDNVFMPPTFGYNQQAFEDVQHDVHHQPAQQQQQQQRNNPPQNKYRRVL